MKYSVLQIFFLLALVLFYITSFAFSEPRSLTIHTSFSSNSSLSDEELLVLSKEIKMELIRTAYQVEPLFGLQPPPQLTVKLLPWTEYLMVTEAPEWTTGMLFRPQVIVISESANAFLREELKKTLRHEYVHASIAWMTNSNSPAWLDEGLAQIVEGATSRDGDLQPLRDVMSQHDRLRLSQLKSDLVRFRPSMVPLAYKYSLFATEHLILWSNRQELGQFLRLLAKRVPMDDAFSDSFGVKITQFEERLVDQLILTGDLATG